MRKIVFVDIDGTMVDYPNGMMKPSQSTLKVFNTFREKGNFVVVASSRGTLPEGFEDFTFDGTVFCDGHYVEFKDEVLLNELFTAEQIELQLSVYKKHNAGSSFSGHFGHWFSDFRLDLIHEHLKQFGFDPTMLDQVETDWKPNEIKCNASTGAFETVEEMRNAIKDLPSDWSIIAYETGGIRMDVYPPGHTKGSACEFLYRYLGISKDDTYAFGDGRNDIEMLRLVGHGIAMGNASDEIKAHADDVTDSVLDDGIAKAFKKYFGIKA